MKLTDLLQTDDSKNIKVAVPFPYEKEIILAAKSAINSNLASFVFIGDKDKIISISKEYNLDLSSIEIVIEENEKLACELCAKLVADDKAQVMMKGLVHTATFSKAFLNKELGLLKPGALLSHIAIFEMAAYHKPLILSDAALNIAPDLDAKIKILANAVSFARQLGISTPKIACISAVEKVTEKMPSTVDADALVKEASKGTFGDVIIEGPLAFDVAISAEAAQVKGIESVVAGNPDILLMPNIESANVLYKTFTQLCNANSAGVIAGTKAPIIVNSRSDDEDTRLLSIALAKKICK